jgi:hypothetical protein
MVIFCRLPNMRFPHQGGNGKWPSAGSYQFVLRTIETYPQYLRSISFGWLGLLV